MRRWILLSVACCLLMLPLPHSLSQSTGVTATLELSQQFYYAGEPLFIRVTVGNDGEAAVDNPVRGEILAGFRVTRDGEALKAASAPEGKEPARPDRLAPSAFYGAVVDLTELFPGISKPGSYEITWMSGGVSSRTLVVRLLPRYDPGKNYVATVETTAGNFRIEFFKDASPIATKAFIDLANAGYFDGLLIHEVRKGRYVAGGDPVLSEVPRPPFSYPAESSTLPVVAGTVVMKPVLPYPPANGSQFMVLLRPEPTWTGQVTVLGQVVDGMAAVRRMSEVDSTLELQQPYYKPLSDIRIETVRISEKASGGGG